MRTSPDAPAIIAGKACSTPCAAFDTLVRSDQLAPPVVEDEKYTRSGPPFAPPAFHSAYRAPAASDARAICAPRYPVWQLCASQLGGALDTSSSRLPHVRPPSDERLT